MKLYNMHESRQSSGKMRNHTHTQHKKALVKYDNKRNVNIDYDGVSCFLKHYALSLCIAYNDCC